MSPGLDVGMWWRYEDEEIKELNLEDKTCEARFNVYYLANFKALL